MSSSKQPQQKQQSDAYYDYNDEYYYDEGAGNRNSKKVTSSKQPQQKQQKQQQGDDYYNYNDDYYYEGRGNKKSTATKTQPQPKQQPQKQQQAEESYDYNEEYYEEGDGGHYNNRNYRRRRRPNKNSGAPQYVEKKPQSATPQYIEKKPQTAPQNTQKFQPASVEPQQSTKQKAEKVVEKEAPPQNPNTSLKLKIVIKNLSPSLTEAEFSAIEAVKDDLEAKKFVYFYYMQGSKTHISFSPSMCFISFKKRSDLFEFFQKIKAFFSQQKTEKKENNPFARALVEYALNQSTPNLKKGSKDPRQGTILEDEDYVEFLETLKKPVEMSISAQEALEQEKEREKEQIEAAVAAGDKSKLIEVGGELRLREIKISPLLLDLKEKKQAEVQQKTPSLKNSKQSSSSGGQRKKRSRTRKYPRS